MYELPKKPEDLCVGLYLAIATVATISPNYLKLFMVIGLVPDTLKSNHRLYGNMKTLEQSERLKKPLSENCPRMRAEPNISAPSPYFINRNLKRHLASKPLSGRDTTGERLLPRCLLARISEI